MCYCVHTYVHMLCACVLCAHVRMYVVCMCTVCTCTYVCCVHVYRVHMYVCMLCACVLCAHVCYSACLRGVRHTFLIRQIVILALFGTCCTFLIWCSFTVCPRPPNREWIDLAPPDTVQVGGEKLATPTSDQDH